jgi:O-acetyl-ADP-ribose deacetylase (regulator of RNase III)
MIKIINDDILNATEDCICHQVNTKGVMGAGVAKAISRRYPVVKTKYQQLCKSEKNLLGRVQAVSINERQMVLNVFGQENYGSFPGKVYTDYRALQIAFEFIKNTYSDKSLAFPYKFGCGLANGDWTIVEGLLKEYFNEMSVTLYKK